MRPVVAAFGLSGNLTVACQAVGIDRSTPAHFLRRNPGHPLAGLLDEARVQARELLEAEAWRRAKEGVEEPVYGSLGTGQGTGEVGTVRRYSDRLLERLLEAWWPERYARRVEVKGDFDHRHTIRSEIDAELEQLNRELAAQDRARGASSLGAYRLPGEVDSGPAS